MRYTIISMVGSAVAVGGNAAQPPQRMGILHEYPWDWLPVTYMDILTTVAAVIGIIVGILAIVKHFRSE